MFKINFLVKLYGTSNSDQMDEKILSVFKGGFYEKYGYNKPKSNAVRESER